VEALLKLKSVLCDQEGAVSIAGSEEDRRIIQEALTDIEAENASLREQLAAAQASSEALVKQAGEVMREECITAAGPEDSYQDDWIRAKIDACDAIRAIPAVTLEDLK
jgi:hypothetical protein